MERKRKIMPFNIKAINEGERSFLAVGSTEDIDRDGDRILSSGWDLANFRKNPVIPWAHRYADPPVAQAVDVYVSNNRLMFRPKFATKDEYAFADTIWKLYKGGFLRAFSVGFEPIRRERVDRGKGRGGYDYFEQELWEISACTVPSNPNAIVAAKTKGVISERELNLFKSIEGLKSEPIEGLGLTGSELGKIFGEILELKLRYEPIMNWSILYDRLVEYANSNGFRVVEDRELITRKRAFGGLYPNLKTLVLYPQNLTKMVPVLAHEVGHLIAYKADMLLKYDNDEAWADALGSLVMDTLTGKKLGRWL